MATQGIKSASLSWYEAETIPTAQGIAAPPKLAQAKTHPVLGFASMALDANEISSGYTGANASPHTAAPISTKPLDVTHRIITIPTNAKKEEHR